MAVRYSWVGPEFDYQEAGPDDSETYVSKYMVNGISVENITLDPDPFSSQAVFKSLENAAIQMNASGQVFVHVMREAFKGVRYTR